MKINNRMFCDNRRCKKEIIHSSPYIIKGWLVMNIFIGFNSDYHYCSKDCKKWMIIWIIFTLVVLIPLIWRHWVLWILLS